MPASRCQTGQVLYLLTLVCNRGAHLGIRNILSNDCNVAVNSNQGCSVQATSPTTYGSGFNANGGGWWEVFPWSAEASSPLIRSKRYAVERTNVSIAIFFWPRNAINVPNDVRNGSTIVDTSVWVRLILFDTKEMSIYIFFGAVQGYARGTVSRHVV